MKLGNTKDSYGIVSKSFHWVMALGIIFLLILGFYMHGLPSSPDKFALYGLHKSIGAILLFLVILRFVWRVGGLIPLLPDNIPNWQKISANLIHYALYGLMFLMPLSGWFMSSAAGYPVSIFGLVTLPALISPNRELVGLFKEFHEIFAWGIIALLVLHILAAVKHHFIDRDNILRRMLPW